MSNEHASFADRTVRDLDFSGAHLHEPNFEAARITGAWFLNADLSGYIVGLRVNDVEVAPLVEAELDRRFPDRVKLRATDPAGLLEGWAVIEGVWRDTLARAMALPEELLQVRIGDEWSFIETLRHLIFATDVWLFRMVKGNPSPFHPLGITMNFTDPAGLSIDSLASPSLEEVLEVRRRRMHEVGKTIEGITPEELTRVCIPPDRDFHPPEEHTVLHCLHVILDEEWEHNRFANRDLDILIAEHLWSPGHSA